LSESLVATLFGIALGRFESRQMSIPGIANCAIYNPLGPLAIGAMNPSVFSNLQQATFDFSQIVICIQIMAASISLPKYDLPAVSTNRSVHDSLMRKLG
jgi:hypothetical protein